LTKEGDYLRGQYTILRNVLFLAMLLVLGVNISSEMPHFSLQSLATTVGPTHHQHLNYHYYLLCGQPSFAYANFVAAKKRLGQNFNKE